MKLSHEAISLRRAGYSYAEISRRTGLAKSTLSYHLSHLPYKPNRYTKSVVQRAQDKSRKTKQTKRSQMLHEVASEVSKNVTKLSDRDILMLGIGLYLGEGTKSEGVTRLVNCDPKALRLFIRWLAGFGVTREHLVLRIHAYPETDLRAAEAYWLEELSLPGTSLQPACIDTRTSGKLRKKGKQPYGTAHLTVKAKGNKRLGVRLSRTISAYFKAVLE